MWVDALRVAMQWLGTVADAGDKTGEGPLKLDVLVVYEDLGTGLRARRALDQAAQRLEVEADFHVHLWKFELLRDPALFGQALTEAAKADIVFISAHGHAELPPSVSLWLRQSLTRKAGEPCALVVSLDTDARETPNANRTLEAVELAACQAGAEVFLHLGDAPTEWESALDEIRRRAELRTVVLDDLLHRADLPGYRHWGINE